jgi:hypothetical protein
MSTPNEQPRRRPASPDAIQPRRAATPPARESGFTADDPAMDDSAMDEPAAETPARSSRRFDASSLLGRDIHERVRPPYWSIVFLILAAASCWFLYEGTWAATAVLAPIGVALALVCSYDYFRPVRFRVSTEGISCSRPRSFAAFEDIRAVVRSDADRRGEFPIFVVYDKRLMAIPARLTCDSKELFSLLRSRVVAATELPPTPSLFDPFLKQQQMVYPSDQIHVFFGSSKSRRPTGVRNILKFILALLLPMPLWIGLAVANPRMEVFTAMSIASGIFAVIMGLIAIPVAFGRRRVKKADEAVLIITPGGLALSQADLRGELRWSEVQKIRHQSYNSSFQFQLTAQPPGLAIRVQGADILIADIYDWPIEAIIRIVNRYSGL